MPARALQLAAAFGLLVGALGVSTALIAQVQEEVTNAATADPDLQLRPPDKEDPGLPIREFTLLDPADALLAERNLRGTILQITGEGGTMTLEAGEQIRPAPIPLGPNASVQLSQGGHYKAGQIDCPSGCIVTTGEVSVPAPANATLLLKPGSDVDARFGPLVAGTHLELPRDTRLSLSVLTMPRETTLPLSSGTTVALPPDQAGTVAASQGSPRLTLPALSVVRGSSNGTLDASDLAGVQPDDQRIPPEQRTEPAQAERPTIEVTEVPETIEKGRPFQVSGYIHLPDGTPSVGHRVTIFANETKTRPGFEIQLGNVETDEDGIFQATARIPTDKPTQPYHIVARAHPQPDADPPLLEAWSDPVIGVEGEATLELDLPERAGIRVPLTLQATLTDAYGAPIPNQPVDFEIHGTSRAYTAITDENGHAVREAHNALPYTGNWTVEATFHGTEDISPDEDIEHVMGVDARIVTPSSLAVARGEPAIVQGTVEVDGGPAEQIPLTATFDGRRTETTTDTTGAFRLTVPIPPTMEVGNQTIQLTTEGIHAERRVVVTVTGRTNLSANAPSIAPLGSILPVDVQTTDERGEPAPGLQVIATTESGQRAQTTTGPQAKARLGIPVATSGEQRIELRSPGGSLLAPATARLPVTVGALGLDGELRSTIARTENVTMTVSVQGPTSPEPLADERIELRGPGFSSTATTDGDGQATFQLTVPPGTELGELQAEVALPNFQLVQTRPFTVLDRPSLTVEVVQPGLDGEPVIVEIQATGQQGAALGDLPLRVDASGAFTATEHATTDPSGSARVQLDRPRGAEGAVFITVQAPEGSATGAAVQAASTQVTAAPFPWWTLLLGTPVVLGGLVYWLRKREPSEQAPAPGPTIEMRIGPQRANLPPVWHPGERTRLGIRLLDEDGDALPGRAVHLSGPGGDTMLQLDGNGRATVPVPARPEGPIVYRARFDGDGEHPPTERTMELRLVDYREEIDREYRDLLSRASEGGVCGSDATPHELATALGGRRPARRLARLFERCDYSPRPVGRGHYERFMRDKEACLRDGHGAS